ncbi:MAG: response regulator [Elusimicrobia bacterium]|nr:response regulator [Elusimicrobiota bacterium]
MGLSVLIVDDDDIAGGLSRDLLKDAGMDAELLTNSLRAIDKLREKRPELVVLDILMPGIDGLSLCHKIKSDPELSSTKVVMVSGKSFEADKQRARQYGADLFIEKPYNIETFATQIAEVAHRPAKAGPVAGGEPVPELKSAPDATLQITVWGCRGPAGPKTPPSSQYGLMTSCLAIETGERKMIFDAGGGIVPLGGQLALAGPQELFLFLTHFHPDHTQGLGAFEGVRSSGYTLHLSGAKEPDKSLQDLVTEAIEASLPAGAGVEANIQLHELMEQTYEVAPGVMLTSFYANHPGTTLGFVLESKGRKVVYCPDSELYGEGATALQDYDDRLARLCQGADLIIHDGRYTAEDYRMTKNSGHSSFISAVHMAGKAGAKRLLLFHADSQYPDEVLDRMGIEAARTSAERGYKLDCAVAREGLKLGI